MSKSKNLEDLGNFGSRRKEEFNWNKFEICLKAVISGKSMRLWSKTKTESVSVFQSLINWLLLLRPDKNAHLEHTYNPNGEKYGRLKILLKAKI